jgi:hypothetical protein
MHGYLEGQLSHMKGDYNKLIMNTEHTLLYSGGSINTPYYCTSFICTQLIVTGSIDK